MTSANANPAEGTGERSPAANVLVPSARTPNEGRGLGWVCNGWHAYVRPDMNPTLVHHRVLWLIRCATDRWEVPGGYSTAVCIAQRESGPNTWPWAYNPSGSAGVFQIIPSTFASWWSAFGARVRMARLVNNVFNARTNVMLSTWAMNAYGLGAWGGGCG